jgi:hypothetical protein
MKNKCYKYLERFPQLPMKRLRGPDNSSDSEDSQKKLKTITVKRKEPTSNEILQHSASNNKKTTDNAYTNDTAQVDDANNKDTPSSYKKNHKKSSQNKPPAKKNTRNYHQSSKKDFVDSEIEIESFYSENGSVGEIESSDSLEIPSKPEKKVIKTRTKKSPSPTQHKSSNFSKRLSSRKKIPSKRIIQSKSEPEPAKHVKKTPKKTPIESNSDNSSELSNESDSISSDEDQISFPSTDYKNQVSLKEAVMKASIDKVAKIVQIAKKCGKNAVAISDDIYTIVVQRLSNEAYKKIWKIIKNN